MSQPFYIPAARTGGFNSLAEASAHRAVAGKLMGKIEQAKQAAEEMKGIDVADIGKIGTELNVDLAKDIGHVVVLSENAKGEPTGGEVFYNPADGKVRALTYEEPGSKLEMRGNSYKLTEGDVTTFFALNPERGVLAVLDGDAEVPRIFGGIDPQKLTAGTIQMGPAPLIWE